MTGAEAVEVADFEATEDASILSLELLRETEQKPARRVVLAADVKNPDEVLNGLNWNKVKAILVDGPEAEPFVETVYAAQTQDEADEAVSEVLEYILEWYALEEKKLLQRLVKTEV